MWLFRAYASKATYDTDRDACAYWYQGLGDWEGRLEGELEEELLDCLTALPQPPQRLLSRTVTDSEAWEELVHCLNATGHPATASQVESSFSYIRSIVAQTGRPLF